ncbi:MAG: hypothetical protein AAGJ55_13055 [Cyanobacteria bacterium J06555_12]
MIWTVLVILLIIALPIALFGMKLESFAEKKMLEQAAAEEAALHRACPVCSETIKRAAKKCIHCGEYVDPESEERASIATMSTSEIVSDARSKPASESFANDIWGKHGVLGKIGTVVGLLLLALTILGPIFNFF